MNEVNYGANEAAAKNKYIYGFTSTSDELKFSGANFTGVANNDTITKSTSKTGNADLIVAAWTPGTVSAGHANQRFLYNTNNGNLYFDGDGNGGSSSQILIALLLNDAGTAGIADIAAADIDIIA
tara:strand:- start:155 stop:529 length:375 start_codon:yes stop_codon:yes gene_type:complete